MDNNECKNEKKQLFDSLPEELLIYIFEYLPKSDLLQMRLVCKFLGDVTYLPQFMKKFILCVTKSKLGPISEAISNDTAAIARLAYPSLKLYYLLPSDILSFILRTLGQKVRSVYLYKSAVFSSLNNCFPELEELIIRGILYKTKYSICDLDLRKFKQFKSLNLGRYFVRNYDSGHLLRALISDPPFKMENLDLCISDQYMEELIIQTLQRHGSSLKYLKLILNPSPALLSEWQNVFSLLNKLETLRLSGNSNYGLSDLVERLPKAAPLKECCLNGGLCLRDNILLKLIIEKWGDSLEKLNFSFCTEIIDEVAAHVRLCRRLKVLNVSHCSKVTVENLLKGLPVETNKTLKVLTFYNNDPGALLVDRFSELATLSLRNCDQIVSDYTLQNIFRYQQKLLLLNLSNCRHITDNDLIGFGANPAPISNLKGLQSLDLSGCKNITDRALIEAFKFMHLRKLILGHTERISSIGIKELVKNCPALEDLKIEYCSMIGDDAFLYITKDLKRLRYLSISHCKPFTGKSIDYMIQYCKSLKRVDFEDVDSSVGRSVKKQRQRLKDLDITITISEVIFSMIGSLAAAKTSANS